MLSEAASRPSRRGGLAPVVHTRVKEPFLVRPDSVTLVLTRLCRFPGPGSPLGVHAFAPLSDGLQGLLIVASLWDLASSWTTGASDFATLCGGMKLRIYGAVAILATSVRPGVEPLRRLGRRGRAGALTVGSYRLQGIPQRRSRAARRRDRQETLARRAPRCCLLLTALGHGDARDEEENPADDRERHRDAFVRCLHQFTVVPQ